MIIHLCSLKVSNIIILQYYITITSLLASYRRTISENITIGTSILNVTATDNDIPPNNMICYNISAEVNRGGVNYNFH